MWVQQLEEGFEAERTPLAKRAQRTRIDEKRNTDAKAVTDHQDLDGCPVCCLRMAGRRAQPHEPAT